MRTLLEELAEHNVSIHRVTQTKGIMTLTDDEILTMVDLANHWQVDLVLAIGPRATTDTSASVRTPEGQRMGYRLRDKSKLFVPSRMLRGLLHSAVSPFSSMTKAICGF